VRARCQYYASLPQPSSYDPRRRGALIGHLNDVLRQYDTKGNDVSDQNRRLVLAFLFQDERAPFTWLSSRDLTPQQCHALERWIGAQKDIESGRWLPRETLMQEANWILNVGVFLQAITIANNFKVSFGALLRGYVAEAGPDEDKVSAFHWLEAALKLPNGVISQVYSSEEETGSEAAEGSPAVGFTAPW
jgi:hypothetical protein